MPAYDFRCTRCSTVFEVTRSGSDDSPLSCPECGGATKRVFTPVGVHFKGAGFYNTDSRNPPVSAPAAAPACPSAGGGCAGCPAAE